MIMTMIVRHCVPYLLMIAALWACKEKQVGYVCPPCDLPCDGLAFANEGNCPHCDMPLVVPGALGEPADLVLNEINIRTGSGAFIIEGGVGREEKVITVYYHKPKTFQPQSRILIVVPGAGRNGDSYRDAWKTASEMYGVLILAPMYPESEYGFGDYHLGGLVWDVALQESVTYVENSNHVVLDEENFSFTVNANADEWLFSDFDRLFELVVTAMGSEQSEYDIFGHSAGGQILHRYALFQPNSKANRIIAANSGFYTLPDLHSELPFGAKNTPVTAASLKASFRTRLVLLIGQLDNEDEDGGLLLRSPSADKQGLHRLARSQFFYNEAKTLAEELGCDFKWELVIVPKVGHDHRRMSDAAAQLLYTEDDS